MKTITINTYSYDELSPEAKAKARDWFREGNLEDSWWYEGVYDDVEQIAPLLGITLKERQVPTMGGKTKSKPSIYFSGFSSQSDGACFEGSWSASEVKADKLKEYAPKDEELHRIADSFAEIAKQWPQASFNVEHSGHYYHKYCTDFNIDLFGDDEKEYSADKIEQAEKDLTEVARDFMQWIYRTLEKEAEYRNSDEAVEESIRANDYDFTEDGKRSVVI